MYRHSFLALIASFVGLCIAATPAEWRSRSIYFLLTDRFARTDNSTTASCDTSARVCSTLLESSLGSYITTKIGILRRIMAGHNKPGK